MIKGAFWLLVFVVFLSACAATYRHPTRDANDFERDRRECEVTARKSLVARGIT